MRPLRDGIQQIVMSQMNVGTTDQLLRTKRFDDIRVYFNTRVVLPTCTNTGITYTVEFDVQPLRVNIKMDVIADILALYLMSIINTIELH